MKKILLTLLFALGLSQAQVVSTLTGVPHHTRVYQSGSNTVSDLDTTGTGILINKISVSGQVSTDSITQLAGNWYIKANGSALFSEGAAAIKANGSAIFDTVIGSAGTISGGITTRTISASVGITTPGRLNADTAAITDEFRLTYPENEGILLVHGTGSGIVTSIDTIGVGKAVFQSYVDSHSGSNACAAPYNSGTTYAANAGVSYSGSIYISNVSSNTGNTPNTSPTQWTAYSYCIDAITYILNNAVFHP